MYICRPHYWAMHMTLCSTMYVYDIPFHHSYDHLFHYVYDIPFHYAYDTPFHMHMTPHSTMHMTPHYTYEAPFHYAYEASWDYVYEIPLGFVYVGNVSVGLSCSAYIWLSLLGFIIYTYLPNFKGVWSCGMGPGYPRISGIGPRALGVPKRSCDSCTCPPQCHRCLSAPPHLLSGCNMTDLPASCHHCLCHRHPNG